MSTAMYHSLQDVVEPSRGNNGPLPTLVYAPRWRTARGSNLVRCAEPEAITAMLARRLERGPSTGRLSRQSFGNALPTFPPIGVGLRAGVGLATGSRSPLIIEGRPGASRHKLRFAST